MGDLAAAPISGRALEIIREQGRGTEMMDMGTALAIAMVVMMVVMIEGVVAGGAWALLRRRKRDDEGKDHRR